MASSRKRALSTDERGVDVSLVGRSGEKERPAKVARKRRVTIAAADITETDKQEPNKAGTKVKRQAWTATAIAAFFEGLCEHGKDFGRILQFMQTKHKKKQDAFIGNLKRNQVRFFYYRTWHKVSTLLATAPKHSSNGPKKLSLPESMTSDTLSSPPLPLPPPPPPPPLPQPSRSQTPPPSQHYSSCNSEGASGRVSSSLLPTTAEPPSTIVMVSEEETEGEGAEGEAVFDTSLDEAYEEVIEKQTSLPEEEEEPELIAGALSIVIGGTSAPSVPSSICEDSNTADTVTPAGIVEEKVEKSDQVAVSCSPRDTRSEAKRDKVEGGKDSGMVMVNDSWFSLDLVALICYSKLKQKCPGDKQTFAKKLQELIFTGATTIRVKGKRKIQVKIPNCPALRTTTKTTLASVTDSRPDFEGECPTHSEGGRVITLDLRPIDVTSWSYVQQQSMNPRLRVTLPAIKTVEDLLSFLAARWHLPRQDNVYTLQLFHQHPSTTSSTSSPPVIDSSSRSHTFSSPPAPLCTDPTSHLTPPLESTRHSVAVAPDKAESNCYELRPLQLSPDKTVGDLQQTLTSSLSSRLALQYKICQDTADQEHGLDLLLRLAEFLISQEQSRKRQSCQVATTSSQEQLVAPSLTSTPTGDGDGVVDTSSVSPSVVTSPSVTEYLRSMPKKSPVKSPLLKYRRMKQLRQQSPLRAAERQQRKRAVARLNFEPSQHSNTPPSTVPAQMEAGSLSLLPPTHQSPSQPPLLAPSPCSISDSPTKAPLNSAKASGRASKVYAAIAPRPNTVPRPAESMFPAAKPNTEKEKKKDKPPQKVHLVTVSKKSLKSSGSFSRLDLSNLFTAVSQNLKDVQTEGSEKSGDKEKESDLQQQHQMSRSPVLLSTNTSAPSVPATLISSTRAVATSKQSSASENHPTPSDPSSPRVPVTSNRTAVPTQSLAPATTGGEPPHPSPLEQLASQVASHPLPPPSVTSSSAASQMYNTIKPVTLSSSSSSTSFTSATTTTTTTTSFLTSMRKPTRRMPKLRTAAKSIQSTTPRPVVPKPLLYLPHMAQVAAQVLPGLSAATSATTTISTSSSSSSSTSPLIPVAAAPNMPLSKTLSNDQANLQQLVGRGGLSDHNSSQVRQPLPQAAATAGRVTSQVVQAQLIALLQNMLQQQLKNSQQTQGEVQTTQAHQSPQLPVGSSAAATAAAQLQTIVLSSSASSVARSLALSSAPNLAMAGTPATSSVATSLASPFPFPPSSTTVVTDSASLDFDQLVEPLIPAPSSTEHLLQTSSDTVNELLRGLCSTSSSSTREAEQQNSLQRLSEETADVLPTFAKAVIQMSGSVGKDNVASGRDSMDMPESPPPFGSDISDERHKDSSGSSDSLLAFLQGENSGVGADSNLKQLADQMDFSDVFSQLKDIIQTPEKHRDPLSLKPPVQLGVQEEGRGDWEPATSSAGSALHSSSTGHDPENSLNAFLSDLLNSPFKQGKESGIIASSSSHSGGAGNGRQEMASEGGGGGGGGEMSLRSLLEENSVDYITRFKELASTMNQSP